MQRYLVMIAAATAALAMAAPAMADDDPDFTGETAQVEETAATQQTCTDPQVSPLLADQGDDDLYFVAPGGSFENGAAGWELDGGASIGFGSNAFSPLGTGLRSLELPAGSTATSPAFCVDDRFPFFRISTAQIGDADAKVKIKVSVVYPELQKNVRHESDIDADRKQGWKLSKRLHVQPRYGVKVGGWRLVALRFEVDKAASDADARVDDILVDPKMR